MKSIWNKFSDIFGKTLIHPQYFLKKYSDTGIQLALKNATGTVVDIGCGRMPYKKRVTSLPLVKKYIGIDHAETAKLYIGTNKPDIFADASNLPLSNKSANVVLMLQVIEHLEKPQSAIKEAYRILKPNGLLILSTVQWYPLHDEPYDYFRYTKYGLQSLFMLSKIKTTSLTEEGNVFVLMSQAFNIYLMFLLKTLSSNTLGKLLIIILAIPVLVSTTISNILALLLSPLDQNSKFPIVLTAIIKKSLSTNKNIIRNKANK